MSAVTAQIIFDLDDPEGQRRMQEALDAPKMKSVLWDLDQWLRGKLKYGHEFTSAGQALEETRVHLNGLIADQSLNIEQ